MRYHARLISADLKKKIAVQWEVSVILLRSLTGVLRFFFSEPFLYRSRTVDFPSNLFPSPGGGAIRGASLRVVNYPRSGGLVQVVDLCFF